MSEYRSFRTTARRRAVALFQSIALVVLTLGVFAVQPVPAQAYQVNTAAPTGAAGGTTTTITEPSGLTATLTLTGGMTVNDITSTMGTSGSTSGLYTPGVATTTPSYRLNLTPPGTCLPNTTCTGLGTIKVTFSQPVTNPVLYLYGLGAINALGTRGTRSHAMLTLSSSVPAGATLGAVSSGATNLRITGGNTIDTVTYNNSTQCNTTADTTPGAAALAGCGSVPVTGTVTELNFSVGMASVTVNGSTLATSADAFGMLVTASEDFGDAPSSYDPTQAAMHSVGDLHLGATETAENPATANATTSPNAGAGATGDSDDAFTTIPDVTVMSGGSYSLTVPVSGVSKAARLCGFIDFNIGGTFDTAAEMACTNLAVGATSGTLTWTVPANVVLGTTYARFRVGYTATQVQTPTGRADSGEVEDYTVRITGNPKLTLAKTASPTTATKAGDTISYSFLVTNTGNVPVTNVSIADTFTAPAGPVPTVTCPPGASSLAAGASITCTASYVAKQADVDKGRIDNSATASGTAPVTGATVTSAPSTATVTIAAAPKLTVVKTASPTTATKAGDSISYSFLVTNTGNVTITGVSIADSFTAPAGPVPTITCPAGAASMAPNATVTCTATYVATQADVDHARIDNSATASGKDPSGATVTSATSTAAVTVAPNPKLTVAKTASPTTATKAGDSISYSFLVTNTGNVTITNVSIADTLTAPAGPVPTVTCPAGAASLAPNATVTCTATYVATQADVDHGRIDNSATASGKDPSGTTVTSPASTAAVTIAAAPKLTVAKTASPTTATKAGDSVLYSFLVTNTGNVTVTGISVADTFTAPAAPALSITCPATTLAPGAATTCTGTYVVTQADADKGRIDNSATASGKDPSNATVTSAASTALVTIPRTASLALDKQAGTPSGNTPGSTIAYTFLVTNTGNVTLTAVAVTDAKVGTVTCPVTPLLPGATATCTATYTLTANDFDAGHVANTASATATPPSGVTPPTPASDSTDTPLVPSPSITLVKTAGTPSGTTAGSTVQYTFTATNTGNVTLTNVTVNDPKLGGTVTCAATTLASGASTGCGPVTYVLTQADVDAGHVANTATASGTSPTGTTASGPSSTDTPITAAPSLTLDKTHATPTTNTAGTVVVYHFAVKNTGNVTLSSIGVADPKISGVSCTVTTLAPGASTICSGSYTLTQADVDAGVVDNTATASGTQPVTVANPNPSPVTAVDTDTLAIPAAPAITVDKTHVAPTVFVAGTPVSYSFVVKNTGNVTLASVGVSDPKIGSVTCPLTTLAPGASTTCTGTYALTQADLDAGVVNNTATASGKQPVTVANPNPSPTTGTDTDTMPLTQSPAITFDKQAGAPTGSTAGSTIPFTFIVQNTGNVTLNPVTITDSKVGTVTCPVSSLAPGASTTCLKSYVITQADINAGHVANSATVSGTPPTGPAVTAGDSTDTSLTVTPSLSLDKQAGAPSQNKAGGTIAYTFLVTNTGNVTLTGVSVTDAKVGPVTCPGAPVTLVPGAAVTCTATYTLTQADVDAGTLHNAASASGTPPTGGPVSATDTVDTAVPADPRIVVDKQAAAPSGTTAGSTIAYTFLVSNTGNVTLNPVSVNDPKVGAVTCPLTSLAPGVTTTCTATYVLTQADVDAGHVANTATVSGTPPTGPKVTGTDSTDSPIASGPGLSLDKQASAPSGGKAGDTITYTFVVTNTGNVTLSSVSVADSRITTLSCTAATLAPGDHITCTAPYALTQADVDAGTVHNDATATGTPPTGPKLTATDSTDTSVPPAPAITLDKQASAPTAMVAGSTIDYTFIVTNTGNVTLTSVGVSDPKVGPVTCPAATLQPTASTTCTVTYTLTQADIDFPPVVNTATASGTSPKGAVVTGTDSTSTPITANPEISLDKQAGIPSGSKAGDYIPYTFVVTNTGTNTLTDVTLVDLKVSVINCVPYVLPDTLLPGDSTTCTGMYQLTQGDVDAGHVANSATVFGTPPVGDPISATDTTDTRIPEAPGLTLVKSAGVPTPGNVAGATIAYSFLVTNTGNVTMTLVGVADAKVGAVTCPVTTLDPTKATTCTATYTLTQADVDAGQVVNSATAHGTSPLGTVTTSPQSDVTTPVPADPKLTLDKQAGPPSANAAGGIITYTFVVTNTGNVTLDPVGVTDTKVGAVTCPVTSLAPGASTTCTKAYPLTQGDVDSGAVHNDATASGVSPKGVTVTAADSTDTPVVADPRITLDKQAGVPTGGTAGDTIAYTFVITNTGNVTLNPVAYTDAKVDTSTCSTAALAVGATRSCTVSYVLTQADVDAGHVANTATVDATPPSGPKVSATDSTDTAVLAAPSITLDKQASAPSANTAGGTITYTFLVTNTGNVTLTSILILDSKVGGVVCPVSTLAPLAHTTCTASYTMSQADVDAGTVHNSATVEGNPPTGDPVSATDAVDTAVPAAPSITLDKQAGAPSVNAAGGTIAYTFIVKNTGNVTLSTVEVSDTMVGAVSCPESTLAPGASTTCTASHTLLQSEVDAGTVHNSASVSGLPPVTAANPKPDVVTATDAVDVAIPAAPALTLDKTAGAPSANTVGGTIAYTFLLTNTGNVTLDPVSVSDPKVGAVACASGPLAPGASRTCTATYTLLQSDVDAENVYNFATASGTPPATLADPNPKPVTAVDSVTVAVPAVPSITIDKSGSAPSVNAVGGTVDYTFLVTNTGNVTLGSISVSDLKVGAVNCPDTTLVPGASTTCTATYRLTQADVDAGTVHNSATVTGLPPATSANPTPSPVTGTDAVDVAVPSDPKMTVDKTHATPASTTAGATVSYSFLVSNTGNVTLTSVSVSDAKTGPVTCPVATLLPGATTTCTASYTLTQADVDSGSVVNTALAHGTPPVTVADPTPTPLDATDTDTLPLPAAPSLTVDKTHVAPATNAAGATVAYSFLVTNTGNVTLSSVGVSDAKVGAVTCPTPTLLPGASETCTASYTLTQADVDAGTVLNTATASGTPPVTVAEPKPSPVTAGDTDTLDIPAAPSITLDKSAAAPSGTTAGSTIEYTFLVTNTGNVTLDPVEVTDVLVGTVTCPAKSLAPAADTTCTATYTLTQADVDAGTVHNDASVQGTPPSGAPVTAADSTDTAIAASPSITVDKQGSAPSVNAVGGTIDYTFLVTNTGNVTLGSISVSDPKVGAVNCPDTTLAPLATTTCTATYTLTQADVNAGTVHNSATVTGLPPATAANPAPDAVTGTDAVDVPVTTTPKVDLVKSASAPTGDTAGATIDYTFVVTNSGNVTLTGVGVSDPKVGPVSCPAATLLPGEFTTCLVTYTLTQADVDSGNVHNSATASGTPPATAADPEPAPVTATDAVDVPITAAPAITLDKQAGAPSANAAGGTIAYTFLVTNTGNVTLSSVTITDVLVGTVTCPVTTLAPLASTTCTATYTLSQADVDSGDVTNNASVAGTPPATTANPTPTPVTAADTVVVPLPASPSITLDKQAGTPSGFNAGDTIAYRFVVTNTGNVTLTPIAVADPTVGTVTCPVTTLAPAGTTTCTATYTLTQLDVDAGHVANTATVSGLPPATAANPTPAPVTATDQTDTAIPPTPQLSLVKQAGPHTNMAGSPVVYTFLVANTGNVTMSKVGVVDAKIAVISCPQTTLAPGESMTCTGTYVLTAADAKAGKVTNTAHATGVLSSCLVSGGWVGEIKANGICDPIVSDESIVVFAMPNTGSPVSPWAPVGALVLLAVGGALVLTGRRRNRV